MLGIQAQSSEGLEARCAELANHFPNTKSSPNPQWHCDIPYCTVQGTFDLGGGGEALLLAGGGC